MLQLAAHVVSWMQGSAEAAGAAVSVHGISSGVPHVRVKFLSAFGLHLR